MKSASLSSLVCGAVAILAFGVGPALAGPPQPSAAKPQDTATAEPAMDANKEAAVPDDSSATRNAARTRMRECGHQWSTMKKAGTASGLTWKDFSQNCLARK